MDTKRNILFILSNLGKGGIQSLASTVMKELDILAKYNLYISLFDNEIYYPAPGTIINLNSPTSGNIFKLLKNAIKKLFLINRVIKTNNIDVVYSYGQMVSFYALLSKFIFKNKTPIILSYHNTILKKNQEIGIKAKIAFFISRKLLSRANKIHTVSNGIKNELIDLGIDRNKITTIYNPVDIDYIYNQRKEALEPDFASLFDKNKKVIITAVRLESQKNVSMLINAFYKIKDRIPSHLVILGDGRERNMLESLVKRLNISEYVSFLGWRSNIFKYLYRSDLFVLCSQWEGFGNVIIEAMACEIPVIATDCPHGPGEIISNGVNGILINPDDVESLSESMLNILNKQEYAAELRRKASLSISKFDSKNIILQYAGLFDRI